MQLIMEKKIIQAIIWVIQAWRSQVLIVSAALASAGNVPRQTTLIALFWYPRPFGFETIFWRSRSGLGLDRICTALSGLGLDSVSNPQSLGLGLKLLYTGLGLDLV